VERIFALVLLCLFACTSAETIGFSSIAYGVNEGSAAELTITRTSPSAAAVWVNYTVTPGSAMSADFVAMNGSVWFNVSDGSAKVIKIQTLSDIITESPEVFTVSLSSPTAAVSGISAAGVVICDMAVSGADSINLRLLGMGLGFLICGIAFGISVSGWTVESKKFEGLHTYYIEKLSSKVVETLDQGVSDGSVQSDIRAEVARLMERAVTRAQGEAEISTEAAETSAVAGAESTTVIEQDDGLVLDLSTGAVLWDGPEDIAVEVAEFEDAETKVELDLANGTIKWD
jgi:hypothetical protein